MSLTEQRITQIQTSHGAGSYRRHLDRNSTASAVPKRRRVRVVPRTDRPGETDGGETGRSDTDRLATRPKLRSSARGGYPESVPLRSFEFIGAVRNSFCGTRKYFNYSR